MEERPLGGSASRRMSGGAPVWSPRLPTAAAATPGKSVEVDGVGSAAGLAEPPAGGQVSRGEGTGKEGRKVGPALRCETVRLSGSV